VSAHVRKHKVVAVRVPAPSGDDGPAAPVMELLDYPEELLVDTIYHEVVGLPAPIPVVGSDTGTVTGPISLEPWASQVCERGLGTFSVIGKLSADSSLVTLYNLSLVQTCEECEGDDDGSLSSDIRFRYVHWDSFAPDGVSEGRFVTLDDGKVVYIDVGWGRRNVKDFGPMLRDDRTGAPIFLTARG
jgi:hypothetical protein